MDQLFGFYDMRGRAPDGSAAALARLRAALRVLSPEARSWFPSEAPIEIAGAIGERGGGVVIDGAARTLRTTATAASEDGRFTLSLLGSQGQATDAARQAARALDRGRGWPVTDGVHDRFDETGETIRRSVGDGFIGAIRDHRDDALILLRSRDCPGQLFHFEDRGLLWFGSHLQSLRNLPGFPSRVDGSAVAFFLAFGFPPLDRPLFGSVERLPLDAALRVGPGPGTCRIDRIERALSVSTRGSDPVSVLQAAVAEDVAVAVAGKTVAVLCAPGDPRTAWLTDTVRRAGAARVVPIADEAAPTLSQRLRQVERLAEQDGETFATPELASLMAAADRGAQVADLCVSAEGSTLLAAGASRHVRFADRITRRWGGRAARAARSQAFHDDRLFVRDYYFAELAVFDDAARLATAGPALSDSNVFAMADELGPDLEAATGENAADLSAALDARFLAAGAIRPLVGAIARTCGVPVRAPFASSSVLSCARSMSPEQRSLFGDGTAAWPKADLAETTGVERWIGSPDGPALDLLRAPGFLARGMVGRAALDRMIESGAQGDAKSATRLWALCCLELWFRRAVDPSR